jgi:hypothetical protein
MTDEILPAIYAEKARIAMSDRKGATLSSSSSYRMNFE